MMHMPNFISIYSTFARHTLVMIDIALFSVHVKVIFLQQELSHGPMTQDKINIALP